MRKAVNNTTNKYNQVILNGEELLDSFWAFKVQFTYRALMGLYRKNRHRTSNQALCKAALVEHKTRPCANQT